MSFLSTLEILIITSLSDFDSELNELEQEGHTTTHCDSDISAETICDEHSLDAIIIIDKNASAVCKRLRLHKQLKWVPIIVLAKEQHLKLDVELPTADADVVLLKPTNVSIIQNTLHRLVRRCNHTTSLRSKTTKLKKTIEEQTKEVKHLKEFTENIVATISTFLLVLDENFNIIFANHAFVSARKIAREKIIGSNVHDVLNHAILYESDLLNTIRNVFDSKKPAHLFDMRPGVIPQLHDRSFDIIVSKMECSGESNILIAMDDTTDRAQKVYQLSMLRQLGEVTKGTLQLDRVLHLTLTCITAGTALGFNRAMVLLVNFETNKLEGVMGVGPASLEEAHRIWGDLAQQQQKPISFDLESDETNSTINENSALTEIAKQMSFNLNSDELPVKCVNERSTIIVSDAQKDDRVSDEFRALIASSEFVAVPLFSHNRVIGVILADNMFSRHPITSELLEQLSLFGSQAATSIETAWAFQRAETQMEELNQMNEALIHSEKLAAIGKMAAHIAHEIRNPLVTIGGFARAIVRNTDNLNRVKSNAAIIVDEVERLENILAEVMDFSRPAVINLELSNINNIIQRASFLVNLDLQRRNIILELNLYSELPDSQLDSTKIRQVIINLIRNAMDSMPSGGTLNIKTYLETRENDTQVICMDIKDSGSGITEENIERIFQPFFTTKRSGTGLGLATAEKIIKDHNGLIIVKSSEKKGTLFSVRLPRTATKQNSLIENEN